MGWGREVVRFSLLHDPLQHSKSRTHFHTDSQVHYDDSADENEVRLDLFQFAVKYTKYLLLYQSIHQYLLVNRDIDTPEVDCINKLFMPFEHSMYDWCFSHFDLNASAVSLDDVKAYIDQTILDWFIQEENRLYTYITDDDCSLYEGDEEECTLQNAHYSPASSDLFISTPNSVVSNPFECSPTQILNNEDAPTHSLPLRRSRSRSPRCPEKQYDEIEVDQSVKDANSPKPVTHTYRRGPVGHCLNCNIWHGSMTRQLCGVNRITCDNDGSFYVYKSYNDDYQWHSLHDERNTEPVLEFVHKIF